MSPFIYPVTEAVSRIKVLDHPADLHEVASALYHALRRCRDAAPAADLRDLLDDLINGQSDVSDGLHRIGHSWDEALERQRRDCDADLVMRLRMEAAL
jgi:hypothetical protein